MLCFGNASSAVPGGRHCLLRSDLDSDNHYHDIISGKQFKLVIGSPQIGGMVYPPEILG